MQFTQHEETNCQDTAQVVDTQNQANDFYAQKQLLLSARLSHRNSVRPSVTQVDQLKAVQAKITKSSLRLPGRLVLGTVKLFHKFEGDHPERER